MRRQTFATIAAGFLAGCASPKPAPVYLPPTPVVVAAPPVVPPVEKPVPIVALLEPYLVVHVAASVAPTPAPLGGRIVPIEPSGPLTPAPPTETRPVAPPAVEKPAPVVPRAVPPALVRLFEEERARAVETASRALSAASSRLALATAEAKKTGELVRAGALAQFKADQVEAAVRAAAGEKGEAEKALTEAQERRGSARRDVEAAFRTVSVGLVLAQLKAPLPLFRPLPFTYRLSVLGSSRPVVTVENGTLGRPLSAFAGEGGAWIVRCLDPSRLRVRVGTVEAEVVVRRLPGSSPPSKA